MSNTTYSYLKLHVSTGIVLIRCQLGMTGVEDDRVTSLLQGHIHPLKLCKVADVPQCLRFLFSFGETCIIVDVIILYQLSITCKKKKREREKEKKLVGYDATT